MVIVGAVELLLLLSIVVVASCWLNLLLQFFLYIFLRSYQFLCIFSIPFAIWFWFIFSSVEFCRSFTFCTFASIVAVLLHLLVLSFIYHVRFCIVFRSFVDLVAVRFCWFVTSSIFCSSLHLVLVSSGYLVRFYFYLSFTVFTVLSTWFFYSSYTFCIFLSRLLNSLVSSG